MDSDVDKFETSKDYVERSKSIKSVERKNHPHDDCIILI